MKKINFFLQSIGKDPALLLPILFSLILNALIWFLIIWRLPATTTWIPLHYSANFGIDWIGPWYKILYYPVVSFLIIVINIVIAANIYHKNIKLSLLLGWASLITQIIVLTGLIFLIISYFS